MGQAKLFNTMILGGYLKVRPVVAMENVMVGLKKVASRARVEDASRKRESHPSRR